MIYYMNNIEDIIIDTNDKVYIELAVKIKKIKEKGLPLLIKINSHPCAGKSTFIEKYNGCYKDCKLYDMDSFPEGDGKTSNMLLKKNVNSILLGCSGGGLEAPFPELHYREKDYDIHDNIVYLFIFPKLIDLYKQIVNRQCQKIGYSNSIGILNYRNNMYELIIKNKQQIRPLFYSFEEGIDYCIQKYKE